MNPLAVETPTGTPSPPEQPREPVRETTTFPSDLLSSATTVRLPVCSSDVAEEDSVCGAFQASIRSSDSLE